MENSLDDLANELNDLGQFPTVKRGRGRPPKNGIKSTPNPMFAKQIAAYDPENDSRTVINDPVLHPYKIIVTEVSFNVVDLVRKEGAIADTPYAYCTTLDNALLKIARLKSNKSKTFSLKEYIDDYRSLIKSIRDSVTFERSKQPETKE